MNLISDVELENPENPEDTDFQEIDLLTPPQICQAAIDKAKSYIDSFFAGRRMHCGGSIPKRLLHSEEYISMVINYDIISGVDHAYSLLEHTITPEEFAVAEKKGDSTNDIKLVNETLKLLAKARVPRQFAGGMLVMYLELVEGAEAES